MKSIHILLIAACVALPSCAGIGSAISGQPIPAVPVKRDGGTPFNVATADVARAELKPGVTWGLYNAGAVASAAANVIEAGK